MNNKVLGWSAALMLCSLSVGAQQTPSSPSDIIGAVSSRQAMAEGSVLQGYAVRNIGPVVQGGRIVDIAVNPNNANHFWIGYASGGLYETKNNGITQEPIFDHVGTLTIGAVEVAPSDPQVLYVGTGENNSSRSSYAGTGVYATRDGGQTWEHLGLEGTQHIGRIVVHPTDANTVWVGAMGALYTHNEDRGVYKSTDGGATWEKTLYINDSTGIIDLVIDPSNPNKLYAAAWERTRKAWNFKGNGPGSGIYVSEDGGATWTRSTQGFPTDEFVGRIGLDICREQPNVVYAVMDYQKETREAVESEGLTFADFAGMTQGAFDALSDDDLDAFLRENGFPEKYTAVAVRSGISNGAFTLEDIANYSGDANDALFDTNVAGASVYRSNDGGKTWEEVAASPIADVYYTYGYYFGQIRVAPNDPDRIFIYGVPLITSEDGGASWTHVDTIGDVHVDHHELWIDPNNPDRILLGNDGGLYQSYDGGANWIHHNNASVGQFYTVSVDMEKPYNVYGGLQDNGSLVGSSRSVPNRSEYWERVFGGDGMYILPDPRNPNTVFSGFQFGNYYRIDREAQDYTPITPQHNIGEPVLRWNWRTPVVMSQHNPDILYMAAQRVYQSFDQGDTWQAISGDLTHDLPQGNVPYSTISWLVESPHRFGTLYAGSDDGRVHLTRDGGATWQDISAGLPEGQWVSSIHISAHDPATVFVTLTGYRNDDFTPYVYRSTDYGKNWTSLRGNLPTEALNVVYQDPANANLLYLGSDHGSYFSLNGGQEWAYLSTLPNVATYDMVVHPREQELVLATHGRSMYVLDAKPLQQVAANPQQVYVFGKSRVRYSERWGETRNAYTEAYMPSARLRYYQPATGNVTVEVLNEDGDVLRTQQVEGKAGFASFTWDVKVLSSDKRERREGKLVFAGPGTYTLRFTQNGKSATAEVEIVERK